ncbi:hypothetical protein PV325_003834 [Microctonus aethiopoides]|uniref:Syndetin n=2 Tax=Microctonus aethiopoides TaxID=144406 RepID=A0AA39KKG0_9HYME|nr:hypothetical protein PV325_003834 [Microctonus aethiopoides]KAK0164652.1 hypothetical protein PV328_003251 [Microctonus aethiopoides]
MDELKSKFLGLINKQNRQIIPSMGLNPDLLNPVTSQSNSEVHSQTDYSTEDKAVPDQDILESIESIYYETDGSFNSCRYELNKLPYNLDCNEIEKYHNILKQQQRVVSKKVLQLILQKQSVCNREFDEILKIQNELQSVTEICQRGRADLNLAKTQFTTASLGILAHYRKRQIVKKLLNSLNTIKTLQRTGNRLEELMLEENYPGAISLLLECQNVAHTYKHFYCVAALSGKLHDVLEQAEQTLDLTLAKICRQFDEKTYSSVQMAYKLLGKTQSAIDQLHMHFTAAIHNTAFSVIHYYAGGDINRQYNQLCESIVQENFIAVFTELSRALWKIIGSYYQVLNWHKVDMKNGEEMNKELESELYFNNEYIRQKLESGITRTWHDIEIKISTFLESTDMTFFKFEQVVQVLAIVNRLMEVGGELCRSRSEHLQKSMRKQSLSYFSHYHASRLDELRIFLEHDGWELCPVKSTFVATQLQEFKSLGPSLINCKSLNSMDGLIINERDNSFKAGWLLNYLQSDISPFDMGLDEITDEDILMNVDGEPSEYFSEDSEDEGTEEPKNVINQIDCSRNFKKTSKPRHNEPMVTNTTLSVLRVCGKYLQMSRLLSSIAVTVIQNMIQFFELCLFSIHSFFASDLQITSDSLYSPKLKLILTRIKENLIIDESSKDCDGTKNKICAPQLSSTVNLFASDKLFGLNERVIGVESLIFLGQQYENLQSYLTQLIGSNSERGFLNQFYSQTIVSAIDLRKPVYMTVISKAFNVANVLTLMNRVNWEVRDVMSQHSDYIDTILGEINLMSQHINQIKVVSSSVEVRNTLWENAAHLITHTLVEGFSNAKKCSNGGRGLMQLDFTQLKSKYEMITSIRPMPHSEYVETYIKAYYIPENILEEWMKEHQEYSVKHLIGLISCVCQNNKKSRQRLISAVEEYRANR